MPPKGKKEAGEESEPAAAPVRDAPADERERWEAATHELEKFARLISDAHAGHVTEADVLKAFGCPEDCDETVAPNVPHRHVQGTDKTPDLLVTYTGSWLTVQHRRARATRKSPVYIFGNGGVGVRIKDPADKFSYIRKHLANPETWGVKWDGGDA